LKRNSRVKQAELNVKNSRLWNFVKSGLKDLHEKKKFKRKIKIKHLQEENI